MNKYAYAVIYDMTGNVIVSLKNTSSFFYSGVRSSAGKPVKNGGGFYCFPGGRVKQGEYPSAGAARELYEETRYDSMNLVNDLTNFAAWGQDNRGKAEYHGIYFNVPASLNINNICASINSTLQYAASVVNNPGTPVGVDWTQCPIDNELASCQVVPINTLLAPNNMYFSPTSKVTGWFYDIVSDLRYRIPNLNPNPNPNPNPIINPFPNLNP